MQHSDQSTLRKEKVCLLHVFCQTFAFQIPLDTFGFSLFCLPTFKDLFFGLAQFANHTRMNLLSVYLPLHILRWHFYSFQTYFSVSDFPSLKYLYLFVTRFSFDRIFPLINIINSSGFIYCLFPSIVTGTMCFTVRVFTNTKFAPHARLHQRQLLPTDSISRGTWERIFICVDLLL